MSPTYECFKFFINDLMSLLKSYFNFERGTLMIIVSGNSQGNPNYFQVEVPNQLKSSHRFHLEDSKAILRDMDKLNPDELTMPEKELIERFYYLLSSTIYGSISITVVRKHGKIFVQCECNQSRICSIASTI